MALYNVGLIDARQLREFDELCSPQWEQVTYDPVSEGYRDAQGNSVTFERTVTVLVSGKICEKRIFYTKKPRRGERTSRWVPVIRLFGSTSLLDQVDVDSASIIR